MLFLELDYRPMQLDTRKELKMIGEKYSKFALGHHYVNYMPKSFTPHRKFVLLCKVHQRISYF